MPLQAVIPMNKLKQDPFLISTFAFWLIAGTIVLLFSKGEIHLYLNQFHTPFFDQFFKYITYLGDGVVIIIAVLVLAFFKVRYGIFALAGFLGSGLFTQIMKRLLFSHVKRPIGFFDGIAHLYLVPGVDVHSSKSFPSGHTTTAFAFFACLAILSQSKIAQAFLFILALLTAYSRVYISQHFLVDIFVGSIIGTATTYFLMPYFLRQQKPWMEFSLKEKLF